MFSVESYESGNCGDFLALGDPHNTPVPSSQLVWAALQLTLRLLVECDPKIPRSTRSPRPPLPRNVTARSCSEVPNEIGPPRTQCGPCYGGSAAHCGE